MAEIRASIYRGRWAQPRNVFPHGARRCGRASAPDTAKMKQDRRPCYGTDKSELVCSPGCGSRCLSVKRIFTRDPPPNLRVSQSSRSSFISWKSTLNPTSNSPSEIGKASSRALRPVKLRIQKLSSHATGHPRTSPGSKISTRIFLANMLTARAKIPLAPEHGKPALFSG